MALSSSVSAIPRVMLMGMPCFLMWLRIGATGWKPTEIFSSLGGLRDFTNA